MATNAAQKHMPKAFLRELREGFNDQKEPLAQRQPAPRKDVKETITSSVKKNIPIIFLLAGQSLDQARENVQNRQIEKYSTVTVSDLASYDDLIKYYCGQVGKLPELLISSGKNLLKPGDFDLSQNLNRFAQSMLKGAVAKSNNTCQSRSLHIFTFFGEEIEHDVYSSGSSPFLRRQDNLVIELRTPSEEIREYLKKGYSVKVLAKAMMHSNEPGVLKLYAGPKAMCKREKLVGLSQQQFSLQI